MANFYCKITPPRPSFFDRLTDQELDAVQAHLRYWTDAIAAGQAHFLAAVSEEQGPAEIGAIQAEDESAALAFLRADPLIRREHGFEFELRPMHRLLSWR